ncbi:hypothetical protein METBIDRAFT_14924, partial [Metschnikowia bicuspidata var. bicuspidata NRRL YB-4993]
VTPHEAKLRRESLEKHQTFPRYQVVEPSVYGKFLKNLYPVRNSLTMLNSNREAFRQVNHDLLFRSYNTLPRPGVAHMRYEDFEHFMLQMFSFRAFLKPNMLSGTNIFLFDDAFLLKQYADANMTRQAHLKNLWQITSDLALSEIPITEYERQNLVYKTFFRERQDIMETIQSIARQGNPQDSVAAKNILNKWQSPHFDFETYKEVYLKFGDATDAEALNVILLTALRHGNMAAYSDIMSKIRADSYTRDTFKILLENLSLLGQRHEFNIWISLLVSRHIDLIDIQLLNTIIFSLVELGEPQLAESLFEALIVKSEVALTEDGRFLKLVKLDDKLKYSLYISGYDQLPSKPPVNYHPTEQTFIHILRYYCESGADFSALARLLNQVESVQMLPITSQMFKYVFRAFSLHEYTIDNLQYMLYKLLEAHDLNSGARDTWVREQINNSALPQDLSRFLNEVMAEPPAPEFTVGDNNFVKLSNTLVRQVFLAFRHTLGPNAELKDRVQTIEKDLEDALQEAYGRHKMRILRDELEPIDLNEREELVYLKKTSLFKLLDVSS